MEIGEFANKTGIGIDTLRYYNKIGILVPQRSSNNRRSYSQGDLEKVNVIIRLKNLNFTLEELKILFQLDSEINENEDLNYESREKINSCLDIIKEKYDDVLRKEQDLLQIKQVLERMIIKTNRLLEYGHFFERDDKMISNYDATIKYWDNVFGQAQEYNPAQAIQIPEIENGISWLLKDSKSAIDFGCGNGRIICRCLDKGMEYVYGIDISNSAVEIANRIIKKFNYNNKAYVVCGGIEKLNKINDKSYESAVLFNILDNLTPEDSIELIKNIHRIVKTNGRILLKFNPYITKEQKEEYNFTEISPEFYKEDSGLYLWNLTNEMIEKTIDPFFIIEKYEEIEFKQYNMINRMYYIRNR